MRLHVLGLPWTETTRSYLHCAYTQKVLKLCDMMSRGYEVVLYAGEENEARVAEHVPLISRDERVAWFGEWDENGLFGNIDWNPASPWWQAFNGRAIAEVSKRAEPHDVLCIVTGTQVPVAHGLPKLMPVEWAVGYEGIQLPRRIFESYAWMHYVYGREAVVRREFVDYNPYDAVIPNFFDPADFAEAGGADDYLLFLGRLVWRKGPQVAAAIADRLGMRLVLAGPGAASVEKGRIVLGTGEGQIVGERIEYVGPVDLAARRELYSKAVATIVPTLYVEPFGGVAVEAMMSGSPVIASDWGAFTETVPNGVGGYRFRTLAEGADAVVRSLDLDRASVRDYALGRYSLDAVYPLFDSHFHRLDTLWGEGWYS